MFHKVLIASLIALGTLGAAQAQPGPRLIGGGEDAVLVYDATPANRAGGAVAQMTGGGADAQYSASATVTAPGRNALLQGGGENAVVVYGEPAAPAPMVAEGIAPRG
ncbi:hypothetical protein [Siccirubricoccus phaeus]|uniref:hypothetical protein n=1 Tax=Siccirubricoccus phaeus TaxID=2595053 RepID=UPI0011F331A8|nr:hypothetical protein [Siccirubricoccus phaeus]